MQRLERLTITPSIVRQVAEIDELKGRWQALERLAPERLSALRRAATIESVGSSTRIEGARLTDDEVDQLLAGLDIRSFRSRDEQEVAGYARAVDLVFDSCRELTFTENHIQQLHGVLLGYSEKDERHRGHYKTLSNSVEAFDESGKSVGVVFETATPFDTPRLMTELVTSTRGALDRGEHHPLLVIAVFVVTFLAIHPFQDGNGRLSRVLTTLLLLRAGYAYVPYSSLERVVEENKEGYYRTLRKAQSASDPGLAGLGAWIDFFLSCLVKQKDVLVRRIERERLVAPLPPVAEQVLQIARQQGRVTMASAARVTGANRNTLKVHLRRLVAGGYLVMHGRGKGAWYSVA
jgi:Fic family protein